MTCNYQLEIIEDKKANQSISEWPTTEISLTKSSSKQQKILMTFEMKYRYVFISVSDLGVLKYVEKIIKNPKLCAIFAYKCNEYAVIWQTDVDGVCLFNELVSELML